MESHVRNVYNKNQSKCVSNGKKPFDKKKYRLKKYSNKYKVTQWEQRRKKAVLRGFYKQIDKDQQQNLKILASKANAQNGYGNQPRWMNAFDKAKQEFFNKRNEKREREEEASRVKTEREEALKRYKEKKMQTYKKLSRKTKKGQPVMKARLEMLLEKIEQQMAQ